MSGLKRDRPIVQRRSAQAVVGRTGGRWGSSSSSSLVGGSLRGLTRAGGLFGAPGAWRLGLGPDWRRAAHRIVRAIWRESQRSIESGGFGDSHELLRRAALVTDGDTTHAGGRWCVGMFPTNVRDIALTDAQVAAAVGPNALEGDTIEFVPRLRAVAYVDGPSDAVSRNIAGASDIVERIVVLRTYAIPISLVHRNLSAAAAAAIDQHGVERNVVIADTDSHLPVAVFAAVVFRDDQCGPSLKNPVPTLPLSHISPLSPLSMLSALARLAHTPPDSPFHLQPLPFARAVVQPQTSSTVAPEAAPPPAPRAKPEPTRQQTPTGEPPKTLESSQPTPAGDRETPSKTPPSAQRPPLAPPMTATVTATMTALEGARADLRAALLARDAALAETRVATAAREAAEAQARSATAAREAAEDQARSATAAREASLGEARAALLARDAALSEARAVRDAALREANERNQERARAESLLNSRLSEALARLRTGEQTIAALRSKLEAQRTPAVGQSGNSGMASSGALDTGRGDAAALRAEVSELQRLIKERAKEAVDAQYAARVERTRAEGLSAELERIEATSKAESQQLRGQVQLARREAQLAVAARDQALEDLQRQAITASNDARVLQRRFSDRSAAADEQISALTAQLEAANKEVRTLQAVASKNDMIVTQANERLVNEQRRLALENQILQSKLDTALGEREQALEQTMALQTEYKSLLDEMSQSTQPAPVREFAAGVYERIRAQLAVENASTSLRTASNNSAIAAPTAANADATSVRSAGRAHDYARVRTPVWLGSNAHHLSFAAPTWPNRSPRRG